MKQSDIDLANAIARGVSKALKETPITVAIEGPEIDDMSVAEAAKVLKAYCEKHKTCERCRYSGSLTCRLKASPENWDV